MSLAAAALLHRLAPLCAGLALCAAAHAQVRYFDRPPTPDEIQAALQRAKAPTVEAATGASAPATAAPVAGRRARGLQFVGEMGSVAAGAAGETGAASLQRPAIAVPVTFDSGSARLAAGSASFIESVVAVLARDPAMKLTVEGHTDSVGNARGNLMLSWERAFTVFRTMVERYGIDPARLQPIGKGASEPLEGTQGTDGRNRRVQFRLAD